MRRLDRIFAATSLASSGSSLTSTTCSRVDKKLLGSCL